MYILLDKDQDSELLHDRPVLSKGRMPHDKHNHNCLDYSQNVIFSPGGAQRQNGLTDRQLQSKSDYDYGWDTYNRYNVSLRVHLLFISSDHNE